MMKIELELPYNKCQRELQELLQAQHPLIFLRSSEESRAIQCAIDAHLSLVKANPQLILASRIYFWEPHGSPTPSRQEGLESWLKLRSPLCKSKVGARSPGRMRGPEGQSVYPWAAHRGLGTGVPPG